VAYVFRPRLKVKVEGQRVIVRGQNVRGVFAPRGQEALPLNDKRWYTLAYFSAKAGYDLGVFPPFY
jgi:hypothetical protein